MLPAFSVLLFFCASAADNTDTARVGVRPAIADNRVTTVVAGVSMHSQNEEEKQEIKPDFSGKKAEEPVTGSSEECRAPYRDCMDQFCLMDASEGERCSCSGNIARSKPLIKEINDIQAAAEKLFGEGVEREKLGAKAVLVFGQSEKAKKSGIDFMSWVYGGGDGVSLDEDMDIGDDLYAMAYESCSRHLKACGKDAKMEEMLYERQITADCKSFTTFLDDQKKIASGNKTAADKAVRAARFEMLDTTNKYNRGECLITYKNCIADKGGCGANFENCLDAELLARRANACDNVLDQCMAVKKYVLEDWTAESKMVLADAAEYADKNRRGTCFARIQACLEDSCSPTTNSQCLDNVNIAAGVCPVINECNTLVPGIKTSINDKLGFLRVRFCQNDIDKCLQEKCGANFTNPACVGKKPRDIVALCPQNMFPSCKGQTQFDVIVSSTLLQMDYQMMQGCINYFSDALGRVCGTDMSCLPSDDQISAMKKSSAIVDWRANADKEVDNFFKQFEKDTTVTQCSGNGLGKNVFTTAKLLAKVSAEGRAQRAYQAKVVELARKEDLNDAKAACEKMKSDHKDTDNVWIASVHFEPSLRNCHICRVQKVCEVGGEEKGASAMKGAAGGLAAGASAGTMVTPGWGTAIGAIVGGVGGGLMGMMSGGTKEFCQELESCEDVNM
jgi:hypothetical protein